MNFVSLVYLARAFTATIRQRPCCSTQTCVYLLSAEQSVSPKRPPHLRASVDTVVPE